MSARPNILLFITDDHAPWTLPCYGNSEVLSPSFDRLAAEGTVFRNAFSPTPVCSPGRACLLTGLTSSQHGVHDWIGWNDVACQERDWLAGQVTLAELLQRQGYATGLSGKWHIGKDYEKPAGYDWHFGLVMQGGHQGLTHYLFEGRTRIQRGNVTEYITDEALGFLDRTPDDQPFFLHVGYTDTHSPYVGQAPELVAQYEDSTFDDVRVDPQHPWHFNEGFAEDAVITEDDCRIRHATQYAAVSDIDQHMGRLIDSLEASGQLENTLVIYTSDHGLALGQNGFWGKGNGTRPLNLYEVSIRVPLIVRGPGVEAGEVTDRCVDHFDTFQAVCEAGGVPSGRLRSDVNYPGRSWLPLASGSDGSDWDDTRFAEYGDVRMARTPQHKLVRRYPNGPDELFDLNADPLEQTNLVDHPDFAETRADLEKRIDAFFARHEDPEKSGLRVKELPRHNLPQKPHQKHSCEAWRDTVREQRGLQLG